MRLERPRSAHGPEGRSQLERIERHVGHVDDVDRILAYRPELWGGPHRRANDAVCHQPSEWTIAERELFATFVSSLNQCPF